MQQQQQLRPGLQLQQLLLLVGCFCCLASIGGAVEFDRPGTNPTSSSIAENTPVGTVLTIDGRTTRSLRARTGTAPYTWDPITGTGCSANFQVAVDPTDPDYAVVMVKSALDFETLAAYLCTVTVKDSATPTPASATLEVSIQITNINDQTPTLDAASYSCSIDEELATNTLLPTGCEASYADTEIDAAGDVVTCSLSGTDAAKFVVTTVTGFKKCQVRVSQKLDYEAIGAAALTFNIEVTDSGGLKSSRPVTVTLNDLNDNAPICSPTTISVTKTETFIGEIVSSLSCSDRDSGVRGEIEFSLFDPASSRYFAVDATSGRVTNVVPLDYDTATKSNYTTVVIKAADKGTPTSLSTSVTVTISITAENDNTPAWGTFSPAFVSSTAAITSVSESADAGLVAFTAQATDADFDSDGTITYSIQSVRGSDLSNLITAFDINSVSGQVSVKTKGILNRESISYADITVLANDNPSSSTPLTITRVVRVDIADANEFPPVFVPASGLVTTSVAEGTAADAVVYELSATDPDASAAAISCTITSGNDANVFKMDATNQRQIKTNVAIEPDKPTLQPVVSILTLSCSDGGLTSTATVTVSIALTNDNSPTLTLPAGNTITIPESQSLGKIADIVSGDNDAGTDGEITCSVTPVGIFSVPGNCDQLMLVQTLDRETAASHAIVISAIDKGSPARTVTVSVTVSVTDVNDNFPVCTPSAYFATLSETSPAVASLTTITCSDADTHGVYFSSNTTGFSVSSSTGVVGYTGGLDYDTGPASMDVIVYCVDNDDANKFCQATVRVTITNENEFTPTFTPSPKTVTVTETINGGQLVTSYVAADADKAPDSIQSYRITSGDPSNLFSINNNGDIFVQPGKTLDYESLNAAGTVVWTLVVEAVDGGSTARTGTGTLTLSLVDANDNTPVFSQTTYTATVAEGTTAVSTVLTVAATDADTTGNFGAVRFSFPTANSFFSVDATSGVVSKTTNNLDYNTFQTVSIPVLAIDNAGAGPNTATATVVITVTDTNVAPTCTLTTHTISNVREDTGLGTEIWSLTSPTAICSDADTTQTLRYSLAAGSDNHFSIHPTTGSLVVTRSLNFESATSHTLSILATDSHATPASAAISVTVTVTDVNEFSPICTAPTSASLNENAASATVYTVASCTDADTSSTAFTYAVLPGVPFSVSGTGVVTNSATLDYETSAATYVVHVTVVDNAPSLGGLRTVTYTTTVTLIPLNDNVPAFTTPSTVYADVAENTGAGTALSLTLAAGGAGGSTVIDAADNDKGITSHFTIVYSIASGNGNGWFVINPSTGVISIASPPDRETAGSVTLGIAAADQNGSAATSTVNVAVTVTDVNDNPPVFPTAQFTVNISEGNTPPNTVVDWSATSALSDADTGANAILTLKIVSGVSSPPEFSISGKQLVTAKTFDLPTDSTQYVVKVIAEDGGLPKLTGTATVTVNIVEVNKVAPAFATGSGTISVPETTAIGSTLYNVTATDTDVGLGGSITYSLGSSTPSSSLFRVSPGSGIVILQNALDYDTLADKVYVLRIVATDSGSPARSNTFTLTVSITDANDNDPVFNAGNEFTKSFAENVGTNFAVTTVGWTDADSGTGGTVTCSIVSQTPPAIFTIDPTTCQIKTSSNPDREARAVHSVEVQLTDGGSRTKRAVFTFTITDLNDNAPVFSAAGLVTSVVENLAAGAAVTTVSATDADAGVNADFEFSLTSHITPGDHTSFAIGATTGVITTTAPFDRETKDFYSLRVLAIDKGTPALTGTAIVNVTVTDVNDNTPTWVSAPYTATVSEGASIGTLVTSVSATDLDSTFGVLTYSIMSGDTLGLFRINNATGRVETAKSSGLNRESVGIWNLTLKVQDNESPTPRTAVAELRVTVTDVNEFAPAWVNSSYRFAIFENSPVGSLVGIATATDNDAGPLNNKINYAIDAFLQGNEYFTIDPNTARISLSVAALDRETLDTYILRLVAFDSATPPKTATNCLSVTIFVTDTNDNDPVFSQSYYNATVAENATIGFNVLTVTGSDADTGVNADLIYSINVSDAAGAIANNFFAMATDTGLLTVRSALDWETRPFFHFPILIRDRGTSPQRTSSASVYILVTDVNDVAPSLSASFYNAEVPQVDDGNMQILQVSATDPDSGSGGTVSYSWNSNVPYFHVDATTGIVNRNTLNSIERFRIYTQDVVARDAGSPQLTSSTAKVRIDTFPAEDYIVMIHFSMSEADYLSQLSTIKTNLAKTLTGKYPNARVGQWKYHSFGGNIVGYFYSLANTLTDNITYINVDKEYVPYTDLLAFWRFDSAGSPTAILRGSDFTASPIVLVQGYPQAAATPWYQTWWGILLLTLAALAAAALLAAAAYGLFVCISSLCAAKPPTVPVTQPVKPPPIRERQILELNKDKHPRHHPKPKGRYLIKENQGQNRGAPQQPQQQAPNNRTTTPRADFDQPNNDGRVSPTGSLNGYANLDF